MWSLKSRTRPCSKPPKGLQQVVDSQLTNADVDVSASRRSNEVGERSDHVERHVGDALRMRVAHGRRTGDHHVRVADRLHLSITSRSSHGALRQAPPFLPSSRQHLSLRFMLNT